MSSSLDVDLMSFTAHKIYGPKGIGAPLRPASRSDRAARTANHRRRPAGRPSQRHAQRARHHRLRQRPATLSRRIAKRDAAPHGTARYQWLPQLIDQLDNVQLCGPALDSSFDDDTPLRLPGNLNVSFGNVDGEALLLAMGNLAVSSGAACTSTDPEPSHVLRAIGFSDDEARSSLRFGLGRFNDAADVDFAIERVVESVRKLRKLTGMPAAKA